MILTVLGVLLDAAGRLRAGPDRAHRVQFARELRALDRRRPQPATSR